jgi:hypothetical protein
MRFSTIALAAVAVTAVNARDPKYVPSVTSEEGLKAIKGVDFVYPNQGLVGTKQLEKQNRKKHVVHPGHVIYNPYYYHPYAVPHPHVYVPHTPKVEYVPLDKPLVLPTACPSVIQWLNPKYLKKMHSKAMKKRYLWSRNRCMKKSWSSRKKYKCFQLHWAQFVPGAPNNL